MQAKPAYLILANGTVFAGQSFGCEADTVGEICFTTSMTGYLETLTDPAYCGQILVQTFPLIGNYGVIESDLESAAPSLRAYIVRDLCQEPSNFRCEGCLDVFLSKHKVVGLCGIDTRRLTRIIREAGTMNAKIVHELPADLRAVVGELNAYQPGNPVMEVTARETAVYTPEDVLKKVVLWDFGTQASVRRALVERGCEVTVVGASASAEDILALNPDGILISNGPGDPMIQTDLIAKIRKLAEEKIPMFGIGLGHILLALSQGAGSEKLTPGHRGGQPVIRLEDNRVFITSQNQGYTVGPDSLPEGCRISYKNGNDGTVEGLTYDNLPAFSVSFYPGTAGGPIATDFLYDRFIAMMKEAN